ncbi:MAG: hypothetical protein NZ602_15415 [Thermoguttaceae bacterium]|nr:hypothetical protein [Thermoguttaceae bacterium]MDW8038385.1 hypothetical protein [Thermoguttaceae bacterium]
MKQLFYTSCQQGKSWTGKEGFQVRAASAGLGGERLLQAVRYMGYQLPQNGRNPLESFHYLPVRLAFLQTPDLGYVLCHSVSAGVDPTTHRPGNFFSHLLLELPPEFSPAKAIQTWGSPFWQKTDGPFDILLPEIDTIEPGNLLTEERLRQFLLSEQRQAMFRFVLGAILSTPPDWRIFVAAYPEEVAFCIYGITRLLPEACQKSLTFSTYEAQPLLCPARLIGLWPEPIAEMASYCSQARAVSYHSGTGQSSLPTAEGEFLRLAVRAAVAGNYQELDQFRQVCDRCGLDRAELLNLAYRAEQGGPVSQEELRQLAAYPRFLAHLLAKPAEQPGMLFPFLKDAQLRETLDNHILPIFQQNPTAMARVVHWAETSEKVALWLASKCGTDLFQFLPEPASLEKLLNQLVRCPLDRLLEEPRLVQFLARALQTPLPALLRQKIESVWGIWQFFQQPGWLTQQQLTQLIDALHTCPATPFLIRKVLSMAIARLLARPDSLDSSRLAEALFLRLGPVWPEGAARLYNQVLEQLTGQPRFWNRRYLVSSLIGMGLAGLPSVPFTEDSFQMAVQARDLAQKLLAHSPRKTFCFLQQQASTWPPEAQFRWNLLAKFLCRPTFWQRIRTLTSKILPPLRKENPPHRSPQMTSSIDSLSFSEPKEPMKIFRTTSDE